MTAPKPAATPGSSFVGHLRTWFLTGLLVLAPSAITMWVLFRLLNWVDNLLGRYLRFGALDYHRIPGLGLLTTALLLLIVGFVAAQVEDGLKVIVSGGVVQPGMEPPALPGTRAGRKTLV